MRRGSGVMISLWLWIVAVNRCFQIRRPQNGRGSFDLRYIDGHALAGAPAIEQCRDEQHWPHDETQMIGIYTLAADRAILLGMIPEISHSGKRCKVEPPGAVATLRPFTAEAGQFNNHKFWISFSQVIIT